MPVIGQAKVIVESLLEFYDRFVAELALGTGTGTETELAPPE
jgi:hypothetical protein